MFLNSIVPAESYKDLAGTRFFADKAKLIAEFVSSVYLGRQRYLCITRPRRFGKSVMADMIGAFFGKASDEKALFDTLEISRLDQGQYQRYRNRYDLFYIDFSRLPRDCNI